MSIACSDVSSAIGSKNYYHTYEGDQKRYSKKAHTEVKATLFNEVRDAWGNLYAAKKNGDSDQIFAIQERIDKRFHPHPPLETPVYLQTEFADLTFPELQGVHRKTKGELAYEKLAHVPVHVHTLPGFRRRLEPTALAAKEYQTGEEAQRETAIASLARARARKRASQAVLQARRAPNAPPLHGSYAPLHATTLYPLTQGTKVKGLKKSPKAPASGSSSSSSSSLALSFPPFNFKPAPGSHGKPVPAAAAAAAAPPARAAATATAEIDLDKLYAYLITKDVNDLRDMSDILGVVFPANTDKHKIARYLVKNYPGHIFDLLNTRSKAAQASGHGLNVRKIYGKGVASNRRRIAAGEIRAGNNNPLLRRARR